MYSEKENDTPDATDKEVVHENVHTVEEHVHTVHDHEEASTSVEISEVLSEEPLSDASVDLPLAETQEAEQEQGTTSNSLMGEFEKEVAKIDRAEDKLKFCIDFMHKALSQHKTPSFRTFWDVRKACMELFKEEKIAPAVRTQLWTEFTHLTDEARRLKTILDEESAFHVEQIDKAISKLEEDLLQTAKLVEECHDVVFPEIGDYFQGDVAQYLSEQKQLAVLNRFATQINAMRKELIQVEMRIRHKNKFFQRLSKAGDSVFPKRKELVKELSRRFIDDITSFVDLHFTEKSTVPFFVLREAIKTLQNVAKILTLNTKAFTETRKKLSECWDKIKVLEKERKQELVEKKSFFQEKATKLQEQIDALKKEIVESALNPDQILKKAEEINTFMRRETLGRDEVAVLKRELGAIKNQAHAILDGEKDRRQSEERAKESQRQQKLEELAQGIEQLLTEGKTWAIAEIEAKKKQLLSDIETSVKTPSEKRKYKLQLEPVRDLIAERKEEALLSLSDDQKVNLENLHQVLEDRQERREEIKNHFDECRKAAGSSGLDFIQAMDARDRLEEARERLAKIDEAIEEVEEKIEAIEGL